MSKTCKKIGTWKWQKKLHWDYKKCTGSLHLPLLKMALIADVFPKIRIPKKVVRQCLKSRVSEDPSTSNMIHGIKLKSERDHFSHVYWSLWRQLSLEKSLLVIGKISALFFNTLTAGHNYSLLNRDNLTQRTQMQLSPKGKTFCQFFSTFLTARLNFENFQKKDDPHSWCIF